mgnify:CR=1 FL=1
MYSIIRRLRNCGEVASLTEVREPEALPVPDPQRQEFMELDARIRKDKLFLLPDISRENIVSMTGLNKNRLAQLIQQYSGQNLTSYINSMRVEYSLELLSAGEETIETVAYDSGFNNVRTFYRIFREKFGMTPAEYRKAYSGK